MFDQAPIRQNQPARGATEFFVLLYPAQGSILTSLPARQFAITSFVFGCIQLLLSVLLWYNPILNPPLDTEGNPVPQDPETGRPLPLDANGKPIEPAWLRPPPSTTSTQQSAGAGRNGKGDEPPASGGGSDDEEAGGGEEKKLLGSVKPEQDLYAVGKQGKRSSHRRERKRR